ncbi:hypothetical protein ZIOFF_006667 [Zingiber officinale]|uniref:Uncharacterized protein n=1 Tax=Zingiber officinale TaxID=94328 RepID=A0A8J5LSF6_ZINOF|nr:hypothetical protein ZIOFF_006667 [Zingiber officinale]
MDADCRGRVVWFSGGPARQQAPASRQLRVLSISQRRLTIFQSIVTVVETTKPHLDVKNVLLPLAQDSKVEQLEGFPWPKKKGDPSLSAPMKLSISSSSFPFPSPMASSATPLSPSLSTLVPVGFKLVVTPTFRVFLSCLNNSVRHPWSELTDCSTFSCPEFFSEATSRIRKNLASSASITPRRFLDKQEPGSATGLLSFLSGAASSVASTVIPIHV